MVISCIGDSLTEGDYGVFGKSGIANVKEKNYPYFLAQIMNCEVRNYGKCGANSTSYIEYYRSKKPDVTNSDIIIIMLGTNGGLDPEHDSRANTDFDEIVKACNGDEPKAEIILCTPPRATENPEYSNCGYMPIIRKAAEFIRNYAFNNKIHLIDIAKYDGFGTGHETEMQPNDGLHFGENGYKKLAEIIAGGIRDYQAEMKIKQIEFYSSSKYKRPVRLSDKTRLFAYESLNHKYGIDTNKTPNVDVNHIRNYTKISPLERYNLGMYEIVTKAPIRICDGELISGAATLSDAKGHLFPVKHNDIQPDWFTGTSHFTADFFEVLEIGMDGVRQKAEKSLAAHTEPKKKEFIKSCLHCIDCMEIWHKRYLEELSKRPGYEINAENLKQVPFKPARNFYEAVQSIWFVFAFMRLTGVWPGIGRIDVLLGKYLKNDLKSGVLTIDEAREILAHFFIKGCEWIDGKINGSGDAQHYQNIVLSGIDENGNDITNEVTMLVLDIVEETGISDYPITVRISKNTDEKFIKRVAEVIRFGGGIIAIYNEDLILESLEQMGYPKDEARRFANDGCWEIQIPGKTNFGYVPFDALKLLQSVTLNDYDSSANFKTFDELLCKYQSDIKNQVTAIFEKNVLGRLEDDKISFKPQNPCTVASLFEQSCIEKGLSYKEGGTVYTVISPHIGGLPDAVNSLYAIKKAVFDDKLITFKRFMEILKNNWEDEEVLRKRILRKYKYFGNDNDEVDEIAAKVLNDFSDSCMVYDGKTPIRFVSGVSTFGRQIEWAPKRLATPFGRKKGEVLSGNMSPTPGTDCSGATAAIKSYCKADLRKQYTGAALDIGFIPSNIDCENAILALCGLIKGFVKLGGSFMQIDTINADMLVEAQKNPGNFQNLSVRVSGWNARFVTMNKQWQDMIIDRTK